MKLEIFNLIKFNLRLYFTSQGKFLEPLLFYVIIAFAFPFTINPSPEHLRIIAPSIISISILFTMIISSNQIFKEDHEDGFLQQLLASGVHSYYIVIAKILSHWLIASLPIIISAPLVFSAFKYNFNMILHFSSHLLLITLIINSISIFSSSLTLCVKNGYALAIIISIPLTIVCLIFLSMGIENIFFHYKDNSSLFLLTLGFGLFIVPICCYFSSVLIKEA